MVYPQGLSVWTGPDDGPYGWELRFPKVDDTNPASPNPHYTRISPHKS